MNAPQDLHGNAQYKMGFISKFMLLNNIKEIKERRNITSNEANSNGILTTMLIERES